MQLAQDAVTAPVNPVMVTALLLIRVLLATPDWALKEKAEGVLPVLNALEDEEIFCHVGLAHAESE